MEKLGLSQIRTNGNDGSISEKDQWERWIYLREGPMGTKDLSQRRSNGNAGPISEKDQWERRIYLGERPMGTLDLSQRRTNGNEGSISEKVQWEVLRPVGIRGHLQGENIQSYNLFSPMMMIT